MDSNLFIGPDAQARHTLSLMRAHEGQGKITESRTEIIPGISLSHNADAQITGDYSSGPENLLKLRMKSRAHITPRWQCLSLSLGGLNLANAAMIGVAIRSQAPQSTVTGICIRSGRNGEFTDSFFSKTLVSFDKPSTHLDVIEIAATPDLPLEAGWRDLMLFFRPGSLELDILDMRFFVV